MWYAILHGSIVFIILLLLLFLKIRKASKKARSIVGVVCVILLVSIWLFPFENLFLTFKTPENVAKYMGGKSPVITASGENSSVVLCEKKSNQYQTVFTRKSNNGYKLCAFYEKETVATARINHLTFSIYHIKNTDDYYLKMTGSTESEIHLLYGDQPEITILYREFGEKLFAFSLAKIPYTPDDCLFLNGTSIPLTSHRNT